MQIQLKAAVIVAALAVASPAAAKVLSLQVDMKTYGGPRAYAAAYIVAPDGKYVATVYVAGHGRYVQHLTRWFRAISRSHRGVDGTTGASVGSRGSFKTQINVPDTMLDSGYTMIVETAVENSSYYSNSAKVPLDSAHNGKPVAGAGYVKSAVISY